MAGFVGRTPFVGRERELQQLREAFDAAAARHGSLVMVAGEPGIGKTALCNQLATLAAQQGGRVLTGHCYEEGDRSLPYLPFVEALGAYVRVRDPAELQQELGSDGVDLARIIPELRDCLLETSGGSVGATSASGGSPPDPEEARYRLFQAVTTFVQRASAGQPILLILEDLHDADHGTLDLLRHLARHLADERLLLVGTYRDVEVDRVHPLSGTLAELRRVSSFDRLHLHGLGLEQVQPMLEGIASQPVARELAEAVHGQTEGNPLFVQEVSRHLVEEGLLGEGVRGQRSGAGKSGSSATPSPVALERGPGGEAIPEGLRDVIGKRLSRLSPACNRLLSTGAVIGREFDLQTLQSVAGSSEDELVSGLEEAIRAAVLEEQARPGDVRYRFAHAFFRQTLYEELIAPRRLRLHQQVARALEQHYAGRLEDHTAELAEHFAHSTDPADLAKAVSYGKLAAQHAAAVYAYGEAARCLERALQVQEALDPSDKSKRCDLLLAFGEALLAAGEPLRVVETIAPQALALAEQTGDRQRASRACQAALEGIFRQRSVAGATTPLYRHWAEQADRYAAPGSADRVRADVAMSYVAYFKDRQREGWELVQRALALARQLDDGEGLYQAAFVILSFTWLPEHQEERHRLAEELFLHRRTGVTSSTLGFFLHLARSVFLAWGERDRFEEAARQVREIAERTRDIRLSTFALEQDTTRLALDGRLEEAVAASEKQRQRAEGLGVPGEGATMAFLPTFWPLLHLGRAEQALATLPEDARTAAAEGRSMMYGSSMALCLGSLGRWTEAQGLLEPVRAWLRSPGDSAGLPISPRVQYLAVAVLAQDRELAAGLRESLREVVSLIVSNHPTCIARHLGAASALLGDREAARRYYEQALEVAGKVRFRPEIALTHLQLAELLLGEGVGGRGEGEARAPGNTRAKAIEHLDFAIGELRAMNMQPALERALQLAERASERGALRHVEAGPYPDRLSEREVEVLRLIAAGRSNREIGERLFISSNTVDRHVSHIFAKTGAANRAEAASYAHRHGLVE